MDPKLIEHAHGRLLHDALNALGMMIERRYGREDHGGQSLLLADAPFVEGAVAATVTAAAGGDIKAVAAAAEEARNARKL